MSDSTKKLAPDESVVTRILTSFTDALAQEEGFTDVAGRLREVIVEKRELTEEALRSALFDTTP